MPEQTLYVPTDASGTQFHEDHQTSWPLPGANGGPAEVLEAGGRGALELLSLDELLDHLGERIFVAERVDGSSARLVSETGWTLVSAARFALDCAEHAVTDADELKLPSGTSLGDVLRAARQYLDGGDGSEAGGVLHRMSRMSHSRRLKKLGEQMEDVALEMTREDEQADIDALDDAAFTSVAAVRDAVLAVVETIRHAAMPHLFESEEVRQEEDLETGTVPIETLWTPWGAFAPGAPHGVAPAWVTARDAAERCRQEVTAEGGEDAGAAEREWQRTCLAKALATS